MAKIDIRPATVYINMEPDALGRMVTNHAWQASNWQPFEENNINFYNVLQNIPEIKMEWYRDAMQFFNNRKTMQALKGETRMAMKPSYDFPETERVEGMEIGG